MISRPVLLLLACTCVAFVAAAVVVAAADGDVPAQATIDASGATTDFEIFDDDDSALPPALRRGAAPVPATPPPAKPATTDSAPDGAAANEGPTMPIPTSTSVRPPLKPETEAAAKRWPVPPGLASSLSGFVPRLEWPSTHPFAQMISSVDVPMIIRNTSCATQWPAAYWTPEYFAMHFQGANDAIRESGGARLRNVKRKQTAEPADGQSAAQAEADGRQFWYYHASPMTAAAATTAATAHPADDVWSQHLKSYKSRCYSYVNVSSQQYFAMLERTDAAAGRTPSSERLSKMAATDDFSASSHASFSWATKLDQLEFTLSELDGDSPVSSDRGLTYDPHRSYLFRQSYLWTAPGGTTTPAHYDLFHNFYFQAYGVKRFLIAPPSQYPLLGGLWPVLHPAQRSAQLNLNNWEKERTTAEGAFPAIAEFGHQLEMYEAILEPGDILYIPPLWFHHVTALSSSLSISVWSHYQCTELWVQAAKTIPLPVLTRWSPELKVQSLRLFLESLVDNLQDQLRGSKTGAGVNTGQFIDALFLSGGRYTFVPSGIKHATDPNSPNPQLYCYDEALTAQVTADTRDALIDTLKKLKAIFVSIYDIGGRARFENYLADYFEVVINELVGARRVKPFLLDFAMC